MMDQRGQQKFNYQQIINKLYRKKKLYDNRPSQWIKVKFKKLKTYYNDVIKIKFFYKAKTHDRM